MSDSKLTFRVHRAPHLHEIITTFGGVLFDNGRRALIPGPGHSRNDRSVSLRQLADGRILIHCFSPKDDWRDVSNMLRGRGLTCAIAPDKDLHETSRDCPSLETKIARARALWRNAVPLQGTLAEAYLHARNIQFAAWPSSLRFLPSATCLEERKRRPALIAAIVDKKHEMQGVHITLLAFCGTRKADVPTPRRTVGKLLGGAVRLYGAPDGEGALVLAEGIETALSASEALGAPAWAVLTAGHLARFEPPQTIRRLIIAADRGAAGEAAAETLMRRTAGRPLRTKIAFAPDGFADWNDWAMRTP